MPSEAPIVRQISWPSLFPQMVILVALMGFARLAGIKEFIPLATATYLVLSVGLRRFISSEHRRGIALVKKGRYAEALDHFARSYHFFSSHKKLDDWRCVTLLSASRMSYREMSLSNMAFCCSQTEKWEKARELYEQVLREFPGNQIASTALKMMGAGATATAPTTT